MERTAIDKYRDAGLLILRVGIGLMFILHGYPKITGGMEKWLKLGHNMDHLGVSFGYTFWGFMASFAEFGGGILLILGLFTRLVAFLLFFTMVIATFSHLGRGDGIMGSSHSIEAAILFISLMLIGPGRHSLDSVLQRRSKK